MEEDSFWFALPVRGMHDLLVEPFARGCGAMELSDQLLIAQLIQANHRATKPTGTAGPAAFAAAGPSIISENAAQIGPEDQ